MSDAGVRLMIIRLFVAGITLAAIAGAAVAIFSRESGEPIMETTSRSGDDYFTAYSLIRDSDLIVLATFVSETEERVHPRNPVTGSTRDTRVDLLRTYSVLETIRGSEKVGRKSWFGTRLRTKGPTDSP